MNLAVIERMARDGDLSKDATRYLIECKGECEWLDYKEALELGHEKQLCDFAKDVLAIKNVGGGFLLIGVKDKSWDPVGLSAELAYDTKLLRDQVRRATGLEIDVDIVHHRLNYQDSTGIFALLFVRSSRKRKKRRTPTLVAKDFCPRQDYGLRRGDIYARRGDSTVKVASDAQLADLLDDLEAQADQDYLTATDRTSPFAVEHGTYRLLERGFEKFVGRESLRNEVLNAVKQDPRIWIINVHGPGGVGKSALVNWAVYELFRQKEFEAIIQLTAKEAVLTAKGIMRFGRSLYSLENLLEHIFNTFQETPPDNIEDQKALAIEYLCAWKTLLVLDNMETIDDARILDFVQRLPVGAQAKVLMTSRQKTGAWELPIPVNELNVEEVAEFMRVRAEEIALDVLCDENTATRVWEATGGLPLAIQWVLGRCKLGGELFEVLDSAKDRNAPVLEFSFRNIWNVLSDDAKTILAATSIFEEPPTAQQIAIATELNLEMIERALSELADVTLVTKSTQSSDGRVRYIALPITLTFARHRLEDMGEFEVECRQRYQKYVEQMKLADSELFRFRSRFDEFGLESDNEKKAAILCQRGQSEMFVGNADNADALFKQARELAPQSAYVFAMSASYELARNRIGRALDYVNEACKRVTRKTGALCFTIKARILDVQRDRYGRVEALERAIEYEPEDVVTRHQYGVALSRAGRTEEAIKEFSHIIDSEKSVVPARGQLLVALKTKIINLRRLGRIDEAESDLQFVDQLMAKYPHLKAQSAEFEEFR